MTAFMRREREKKLCQSSPEIIIFVTSARSAEESTTSLSLVRGQRKVFVDSMFS